MTTVASADVTFLVEGVVKVYSRPSCLDATLCSSWLLLYAHKLSQLILLIPSYPLASANTTCCQLLAINGLLCRSLDHLSAPPHHMLGYGDLDLLSGPPHSTPNDPPLRLPSP
jgi:hypothetical protein